MKIDVTPAIIDVDGKPVMTVNKEKEQVELTLRAVCVNALIMPKQNKNLTGEEKIRNDELARKIYNNNMVDFEAEEISWLLKGINDLYPAPVIYAQAKKMLSIKENKE